MVYYFSVMLLELLVVIFSTKEVLEFRIVNLYSISLSGLNFFSREDDNNLMKTWRTHYGAQPVG